MGPDADDHHALVLGDAEARRYGDDGGQRGALRTCTT